MSVSKTSKLLQYINYRECAAVGLHDAGFAVYSVILVRWRTV
jgi:hypothetical protein